LTFKTHIEKEIMCDLLNLDAENKNFLSILEEGQCIMRTNSIKEPFLLRVPYVKQGSLSFTEIINNNKLLLKRKRERDISPKRTKKIIPYFYFKKKSNKSTKALYKNTKRNKNKTNTNIQIFNELETFKTPSIEITHSMNDLESKALEDLENYIKKLNKIQNEKE
ncbi:MAG: hypothetical protein ACW980_25055, partial [Promethearchaeota archaeon]